LIPFDWIIEARERIKGQVETTPLTFDEGLNLFLKWENQQVTGSFKGRGAMNKVLSLQPWELQKGLVSCSAGNHGQGVALAAKKSNTVCTVFAPSHISSIKLAAMRNLGAEVILIEGGYVEAEMKAKQYADAEGRSFISPYNDVQIMAGQGTIGFELLVQVENLKQLKNILVPVGGGGLICGLGAALEGLGISSQLIGVQSEASAYAHALLVNGTQENVVEVDSLADGLSGKIDEDSLTIPLMREYVDEILLVSEDEIRAAIRYAWNHHHQKIEGSAAVSLATRLTGKINQDPALAIITGGNIDHTLFSEIVAVKG
jgi:threonine dehydratase